MARDTIRAVRLVYIRDLLQQSPQSIRDLASLCEVSPETIARDLVVLQLPPMSMRLRVVDGRWTVVEGRAP
mgnify:CR=1 FL=1|jgi:DeoR/GlpR family transcriptional regulator of sugar metabolism